ncbi:MAG: CheR family methyltransferase [bacterium]
MAEVGQHISSSLKSPDENVRVDALESMRGQADEYSLSLFKQALGDNSWRVRKTAVDILKGLPEHQKSSRLFINSLEDEENAARRSSALEGLVSMGKTAVPYLLEALDHENDDVKKFIVDILGEIKDPSVVDAILPLTRDSSENIRLATVETLGSIGGENTFQALLSLLSTEDVSLQFSVLYALGRVGKPIPLERIKPLLDQRILRRAVYDALGETRSPEALSILVQGVKDTGKSARQSAVRALDKLSREPRLEKLAENEVNKNLAGDAVDFLGELLQSNNLAVKKSAARLLGMIGTSKAGRTLARAFPDDSISSELEDALKKIQKRDPAAYDSAKKEEPAVNSLTGLERSLEIKSLGPMNEKQFTRTRDLVAGESGLFYDHELKYLVERRVQKRMESLQLNDYDQYLEMIESNGSKGKSELRELMNDLSTNETYFFREDFQLQAFKQEILPPLLEKKKKSGRGPLRIWSAGCSSGEEPYTIAMIVKELADQSSPPVEIIGSDFNREMIEKARLGLYNPSSFRTIEDSFVKKYFTQEAGRYRIKDEIKKMVAFDTTNILHAGSSPHLKNLEVVFCRNVIIYFSAEAKRRAVEQFYSILKPGGYLLLGHSESLMSVSTSFELVHLKNDLVYRKPESEGGP